MSITLNSLPGEGRELKSLEMGRVLLFKGGPPASSIPTPWELVRDAGQGPLQLNGKEVAFCPTDCAGDLFVH